MVLKFSEEQWENKGRDMFLSNSTGGGGGEGDTDPSVIDMRGFLGEGDGFIFFLEGNEVGNDFRLIAEVAEVAGLLLAAGAVVVATVASCTGLFLRSIF
jgi:hypothetical protein